jgi:hypothetical protein
MGVGGSALVLIKPTIPEFSGAKITKILKSRQRLDPDSNRPLPEWNLIFCVIIDLIFILLYHCAPLEQFKKTEICLIIKDINISEFT